MNFSVCFHITVILCPQDEPSYDLHISPSDQGKATQITPYQKSEEGQERPSLVKHPSRAWVLLLGRLKRREQPRDLKKLAA